MGSVVAVPGLSCSTAYGIFPDQGSNWCFLHWQADSLALSYQGSPPPWSWAPPSFQSPTWIPNPHKVTFVCICVCVCALTQSSPTICSPIDRSPPGSSVQEFSRKDARVGCHFLLHGIFPTQGLNPHLLCLLHWRGILYQLSHWGSPKRKHSKDLIFPVNK